MQKKYSNGFTIIELLVVIAIIVTLASVVMSALATAREKGMDAAIKASINNLRSQADIYGSRNANSYTFTDFCTDSITVSLTDSVEAKNGDGNDHCLASADAWVYATPLVEETDTYYCADSTGTSHTVEAAFAPDATDASCAAIATP